MSKGKEVGNTLNCQQKRREVGAWWISTTKVGYWINFMVQIYILASLKLIEHLILIKAFRFYMGYTSVL